MVGALNRKEHVMQVSKALFATAMVIGVAGGSYGLASAATGSGTTTATTPSTQAAAPSAQQPWGDQRSDETPLTGDALAKVTAVANAQVAGGNAKYEAHMTKADGTPVTVYVDANYNFVSVQTR
jgi:hypothetical protein